MSAAVMGRAVTPARHMPWGRLWRNAQAWAVTVALHGAVVALLVVGWTLQQPPVSAPAVLKTRLITLPAEPVAAPAPDPLPVATPAPVIEAKPEVKPAPIDPQIQARKREQAALARKRVAEQKQALEARQLEEQQARLRELQQITPGVRNSRQRLPTCANICPSARTRRITRSGRWIKALKGIARWSIR